MSKPESICIFGDSTAWGAWDLGGGGWVGRLWSHVGNRDDGYVEIYNLSISGGTTETILARFESEAKIRNADALIFQTGGNDAAGVGEPSNPQIKPEEFRQNLEEIIRRAKKITDRIIFIGFKNCDERLTTPVPWRNYHYTNAALDRYNKIMAEVCAANKILFLQPPQLSNDEFEDGIHPNSRGHERMFEVVRDFLVKENWI